MATMAVFLLTITSLYPAIRSSLRLAAGRHCTHPAVAMQAYVEEQSIVAEDIATNDRFLPYDRIRSSVFEQKRYVILNAYDTEKCIKSRCGTHKELQAIHKIKPLPILTNILENDVLSSLSVLLQRNLDCVGSQHTYSLYDLTKQ